MNDPERVKLEGELRALRRKVARLEAERGKAAPMLESIVRAVPDIVYRLDARGRILYISDAVRRYGYDPERLIGTSILELVHPQDRAKAVYKINERRTGARSTRLLRVRLLCKDETSVDFEFNADGWPTFLVNAEGIYAPGASPEGREFLCTQGVARDISARPRRTEGSDDEHLALRDEIERRRRIEEELRLTQLAVDRASEAIFWFGADGRIIYANAEACRLLGYEREEMLSLHVGEIGTELSALQEWPRLWAQIRRDPHARTIETFSRHKDGRLIPTEVTANYLHYNGRGIVCSYVRDISGRKRREARRAVRLRVREEVWKMQRVEDIEKVIRVVREGLEELGVPAQGCSIHLVEEREGRPRVRLWCNREREDGWTCGEERRVGRTDEWIVEIWRSGRPVYRPDLEERDEHGEAALLEAHYGHPVRSVLDVPFSHGLLGINNTRPHAFAQEHIEEVKGLVGVLSEGFRRLDDLRRLADLASGEQLLQAQKMEAVGELAAGVAHNFNNMLQGIIGNIHLARLEVGGEARHLLDAAEETSMRAAEMVRQLMLFAHRGFLKKNRQVDLAEIVRKAVQIARSTFGRRIEIAEDYAAESLPLHGDAGHLQQVCINVLLNARDALAARDDPRIQVGCARCEDGRGRAWARLVIADNGAGMDADTRARIFEPFFSTKPVDQGTGLGLSTAYGIVQQHGGRIECRSAEGVGTSFSIYLPLAAAHPSPAAKILIVDDEEVVRRTTQRILEQCGFWVRACSAPQAVEVALEEKVDLILLDWLLGDRSGRDVLRQLRARGSAAKAIAFTGRWLGGEALEGVCGVVQKPMRPDDLIRRVRDALEQ